MSKSYNLTKKFIMSYFDASVHIPYQKIYLVSTKNINSKRYKKFVINKIVKCAKLKIQKMSCDICDVYNHHLWFIKMLDVLCKIFRDINQTRFLKHKIFGYLQRKILCNESILINELSIAFYNVQYNTYNLDFYKVQQFKILLEFYKIDILQQIETAIINKYMIEGIDSIQKIMSWFDNLKNELFNIKRRLASEICMRIDDNLVYACLKDKRHTKFIEYLYENDINLYTEVVSKYIEVEYKYKDPDLYVDEIFRMHTEYMSVQGQFRIALFNKFISLDINCDKIIIKLNELLTNEHDTNVNFIQEIDGQYNREDCEREFSKSVQNINKQNFKHRIRLFYDFVGFLFSVIKNTEVYECKLRKSMCIRLMNARSIDLHKEDEFLDVMHKKVDRIYMYKLEDVLDDFRRRVIINNYEIMMLRKFQWIEFETIEVEIDELQDIKNEYEHKTQKYEKKKLKWLDLQSSVEIEINEKCFLITLIQYKILQIILNNGEVKEIDTYIHNNLSGKLKQIYVEHYEKLLNENFLVVKEGSVVINEKCKCSHFLLPNRIKQTMKDVNHTGAHNTGINEVLNTKIMRIMKSHKKIDILELKKIVNDEGAMACIEELCKKGYLIRENGNLQYVP